MAKKTETGRETRIWLVGNGGFYNRGCEAIHRATMELLVQELGSCHFTAWSRDCVNDSVQGKQPNVQWQSYYPDEKGWLWSPCSPWRLKLPLVQALPPGRGRRAASTLLKMPDCVLSLGGDNFSLDYGLPGSFVAQCEYFRRRNIPTVIWSASVGPFGDDPVYEKKMAEFLSRVSLITVRESFTLDYLRSLGITENVVRVNDVAFALEPEEYRGPEADFISSGDVIGINVSELILRWYPGADRHAFQRHVADFTRQLVQQGYRVAFVPHVARENGSLSVNDAEFLTAIRDLIPGRSERIVILPGKIPARQLKWAISRCRFFFGARTHATIAAISSGVPTVAIVYSAKARGIWKDVFGHSDYLLETDSVSSESLMEKMRLLIADENTIRTTLERKHEEMLDGARKNAKALSRLLAHNHSLMVPAE